MPSKRNKNSSDFIRGEEKEPAEENELTVEKEPEEEKEPAVEKEPAEEKTWF